MAAPAPADEALPAARLAGRSEDPGARRFHARPPAPSAVSALQALRAAQLAQAAALLRQRDLASRAAAPEQVALDGGDPDVAELADHFHISDRQARLLHEVMQSRKESFAEDLDAVWKALEKGEEKSRWWFWRERSWSCGPGTGCPGRTTRRRRSAGSRRSTSWTRARPPTS
ncbi:unnamed protein product [Prorocentrum cordatum]|uniref:Uncharacterized protein n=1 Tax=Prorocentrum cordatum TaxID=2364126 RepID=A0ABN9TY15_9DINO|nr:unnamed protein product [Polarella glacialis]